MIRRLYIRAFRKSAKADLWWQNLQNHVKETTPTSKKSTLWPWLVAALGLTLLMAFGREGDYKMEAYGHEVMAEGGR